MKPKKLRSNANSVELHFDKTDTAVLRTLRQGQPTSVVILEKYKN